MDVTWSSQTRFKVNRWIWIDWTTACKEWTLKHARKYRISVACHVQLIARMVPQVCQEILDKLSAHSSHSENMYIGFRLMYRDRSKECLSQACIIVSGRVKVPSLVSKVVDFCCSCAAWFQRLLNSQATKWAPPGSFTGSLPLKKLPKTQKERICLPTPNHQFFRGEALNFGSVLVFYLNSQHYHVFP